MKHKIVTKDNGKFGIMRIASGCVYGEFDTFIDAMEALSESLIADSSMEE